ncbi:peptidase M3, partial [Bacillus wiedmannii]
LERNITSVSELESWLLDELRVTAEIEEEITSSLIAMYRDTNDRNKRNLHMYNQNTIQPLLKRYNAKFDQKFRESPFSDLLNEQKYSFMKKARLVKSKMFNEKNIALSIKEQKLITKYREIISNISINWE